MTSRPGDVVVGGEGALLSLHEDVDDCRGQGELDIFLLLRDDDIGALAELDGAAGDEVAGEAPEVDHGEVLDLRISVTLVIGGTVLVIVMVIGRLPGLAQSSREC